MATICDNRLRYFFIDRTPR